MIYLIIILLLLSFLQITRPNQKSAINNQKNLATFLTSDKSIKKDQVGLLYAPWRENYFNEKQSQNIGCIFCHKINLNQDKENLIVKRYKHFIVMLNNFPYASGHLLIIPLSHKKALEDLSEEERIELMEIIVKCIVTLKKILHNDGTNVGFNLESKAAGASIPDHLHCHILPRKQGDIGFIQTISDTSVITLNMQKLYQELKELLD